MSHRVAATDPVVAALLPGVGLDLLFNGLLTAVALGVVILVVAWRTGRRREPEVVELHDALLSGQLGVQLQPIMRPRGSAMQLVGFECLARWRGADGQHVPPARFVPLAERSGLGRLLLQSVIAALLRDFGRTLREHPWLIVAVNLSPRDIAGPGQVEDLGRMLSRAGVRPEQVVLELTEGDLLDADYLHSLARAREVGHPLGIGDFDGSAENAHRLMRLRPDLVKVDRNFVIASGARGAALRNLVTIVRAQGARVVIQGIETAAEAECLRDLGDVSCQGRLWSPPLDPSEAIRLVYANVR